MSNTINKAIAVGSCVAMVTVTTKAIKKLKSEPVTNVPYTVGEAVLWLSCIKLSTSILTSNL